MPTVYSRLLAYCEKESKPLLTHKQKTILGRKINQDFKSLPDSPPVPLKYFEENDGSFKVIIYPDSFTPMMDELIGKYYRKITNVPKRKRKKVALYSTKISTNNPLKNVS